MAASISGVVTDNDGQPLSNINILLENNNEDFWEFAADVSTNADGIYSFTNLPIGDYRVSTAYAFGYVGEFYNNVANEADASIITLESDASAVKDINFVLDRLGQLKGTIRDIHGEKISYSDITIFKFDEVDQLWRNFSFGFTEGNGQYEKVNLPVGMYRLKFQAFGNRYEYYEDAHTFDSAKTIEIALNDIKVIDVVLGDLPTGSIRGKISDFFNSGVQVPVVIIKKENNQFIEIKQVSSAVDGTYHFDDLLAGEYFIRTDAYHETGYINKDYNNGDSITLSIGESLDGVDIQLDKRGQIQGTIKDINGNLIDADVQLYRYDQESQRWVVSANTFSVADNGGTYHFNTFNERNRILFSNFANNTYAFNDNVASIDLATDIIVNINEVMTVDAVLGDIKFGSISGIVNNIKNQPIENGSVSIVVEDKNGSWLPTQTQYFNSNTFNSNQYIFSGLTVGTYKLYATDEAGDFRSEFYADAVNIESANEVTINSGDKVNDIDFQLDRFGSIVMKVTDDTGQVVFPYTQIYKLEGNEWRIVDISGFISGIDQSEFTHLEPGSYRVKVVSYSNDLDANFGLYEYYDNAASFNLAKDINIDWNDRKTINIVHGQSSSFSHGQLSGLITNTEGLPLSFAEIELKNSIDGSIIKINADSEGKYLFTFLEEGNYQIINASKDSYILLGSKDVFVSSGSELQNVDITLEIKGLSLPKAIPTLQKNSLLLLILLLMFMSFWETTKKKRITLHKKAEK